MALATETLGLNDDIWHLILQHVRTPSIRLQFILTSVLKLENKELSSVCRTSKSFSSLTIPILYNKLVLGWLLGTERYQDPSPTQWTHAPPRGLRLVQYADALPRVLRLVQCADGEQARAVRQIDLGPTLHGGENIAEKLLGDNALPALVRALPNLRLFRFASRNPTVQDVADKMPGYRSGRRWKGTIQQHCSRP